MKAKLGWALGVNVAVACVFMQGCKAPRVTDDQYGNNVKTVETAPAPADEIKVAETPAPVVAPVPAEPAPAPIAVKPVAPVAPVAAEPAPAPALSAPAAEYTLYTVRPGDMLSKIARRYKIRQRAILDLNPGLAPNRLYAGKKIKLPGQIDLDAVKPVASVAPVAPVAATPASVKPPKADRVAKYVGATTTYVVKSGDSLGKIAHQFHTNVRVLKEINGLQSDRVNIGRKLTVPDKKGVKAADAKVAAKAGNAAKTDAKAKAKAAAKKPDAAKGAKTPAAVTPDAADKKPVVPAEAKGAAADAQAAAPAAPETAVQPAAAAPAENKPAPAAADASAAPAPQPAAPEVHTVKEGEDLVSIAISYGVSPSALMDINDLKSSEVKPGDTLKIPPKSAQ